MDEETIEKKGLLPTLELLNSCSRIHTDPTNLISTLHAQYGVRVFFTLYSSPDKRNSCTSIASLSQAGIGLPDRDYYFDEDKQEKRMKYVEYLQKMFNLLGTSIEGKSCEILSVYKDELVCADGAQAVLEIETLLATAHLSRTEMRDPELTYNKMNLNDLSALCRADLSSGDESVHKGMDWPRYFAEIGKPEVELGDVNITSLKAFSALGSILQTIPSEKLMHYCIFHCMNSVARHLPLAFSNLYFEFFEKELKGTAEQKPRWKKSLEFLEDSLGEALGKLYVQKHFQGDAKQRALQVVEAVRDALRERLQEVPWMSDTTRAEALIKMEKFRVKIGYPVSNKELVL